MFIILDQATSFAQDNFFSYELWLRSTIVTTL